MSRVPIITVFENAHADKFIKFFESQDYFPNYDAVHGRDYQWMQRMLVHDHRLYTFKSGVLSEFTAKQLQPEMYFWPQLLIAMQEGEPATEDQWDNIANWLASLENPDQLYSQELLDQAIPKQAVEKIVMQRDSDEPAEFDGFAGYVTHHEPKFKTVAPGKSSHEFNKVYLEERDTMLYQVDRTGTRLPFTVVVEHFRKRGLDHSRFFTDIYGSGDWGRSRYEHPYDYGFLLWLWKSLGLDGEFSMELVKERARRCYPERLLDGETMDNEPIVYRASIGNVIRSLEDKDLGALVGDIPDSIKKRRLVTPSN